MPLSHAISRASRKIQVGRALGAANCLTQIAAVYGGTDKLEHGYLPYYGRHFASVRHKRLIVWEIGVGGYDSASPGGSLPVWRDYFYRSTVIGLDIHPKTITFGRRVKFEKVDQASATDLQRVVDAHGIPDVVIDDGSHVGAHIWASFEFVWPLLPPGAVYAIEDLSTSYYPKFGGASPAPADSGVALTQVLVDSVQALDPTFSSRPEWGSRDVPRFENVAAVNVYPGITFIEKAHGATHSHARAGPMMIGG